MSTFVNLLDIVYPVGAVYMSQGSTSPATLFGGTWDKVTGGCLACAGTSGFAVNGSAGGSTTISVNQMPSHSHRSKASEVVFNLPNGTIRVGSGTGSSFYQDYMDTQNTGGGNHITLPTFLSTLGNELLKFTGGGLNVIFH